MKDQDRLRIAQEAARLMVEEALASPAAARKKAAQRLGLSSVRNLPNDDEIDAAVLEFHRVFKPHIQPQNIWRLRKIALEAMRFLAEFSPLLVGAVWDGSAGRHDPVYLHLFPNTPEEVMHKLLEAGIPFQEKTQRFKNEVSKSVEVPMFSFLVDEVAVELLIFALGMRNKSLGSRIGKRLQGGHMRDLQALLDGQTTGSREAP